MRIQTGQKPGSYTEEISDLLHVTQIMKIHSAMLLRAAAGSRVSTLFINIQMSCCATPTEIQFPVISDKIKQHPHI